MSEINRHWELFQKWPTTNPTPFFFISDERQMTIRLNIRDQPSPRINVLHKDQTSNPSYHENFINTYLVFYSQFLFCWQIVIVVAGLYDGMTSLTYCSLYPLAQTVDRTNRTAGVQQMILCSYVQLIYLSWYPVKRIGEILL